MKSNKNVIDTVIQTLGFNGPGLGSNSSELVIGAEKERVLKTLKYKRMRMVPTAELSYFVFV
jgi:hypothetical protein